MAEVLLDTNIILDYLDIDRPAHMDASTLFESLFESGEYVPAMSSSSLTDVYYIMCKKFEPEVLVRQRLKWFTETVQAKELTTEILNAAFDSNEPDFEDAIIRATAEVIGARAIITRDKKAFKNSFIPSMDARAFCEEMN